MAGNRRYRVGEKPVYDRAFDREYRNSFITNPLGPCADNVQNFGTFQMLNTRTGIKRLLDEWQGDTDGLFLLKKERVPSKLSKAEQAVKDVKLRFEKLKQKLVNSGKFPPKKMPKSMEDDLLVSEARLDVIKAEIKRLKDILLKTPETDGKKHETFCLPRGPEGIGKMRGGILRFVDGQDVFPDTEGVLRIKDERSPYNGMRTADYFEKVVMPYRQMRDELLSEYHVQIREAEKKGVTPAAVAKKSPTLPEWPDGVEHYCWEQ